MDERAREKALRIGHGNVSAGVRRALHASRAVTNRESLEPVLRSDAGGAMRKISATLTDRDMEHATWLGHGNASAGVRYALRTFGVTLKAEYDPLEH